MQTLSEIVITDNTPLTQSILDTQQPLVLRDIAKNWPVVKAVSDVKKAAYLAQFSANKSVPAWVLSHTEKGRFFYNKDMTGFNFTQQHLPFNNMLGWLVEAKSSQEQDTVYMGSTSVDALLPQYRQHNDVTLLKQSPLISLWMGNQSRVAAHFDATDNVAVVLAGKRKFTLFPPEQWDNLYVGPIEFNPAGQAISLVDFHQPDLQRFPKFADAQKASYEVELEAGDGIYIPSMWWHSVEALSNFNLLQNYWWRQAPEAAANPTDALIHAMLAIKDLPHSQRKHWREIFDKLIFNDYPAEHIPLNARGFHKPLDEIQAKTMRKILSARLQNE